VGTYTKFAIKVMLQPNTPASLLKVLNDLVNRRVESFEKQDALAKGNPRWNHHYILDSMYGPEIHRCKEAHAFISDYRFQFLGNPIDDDGDVLGHKKWEFDNKGYGSYSLTIGTNMKNYDLVIEKFWAWISPWLSNYHGEIVGGCMVDGCALPDDVIVGQPIHHGRF
jgi:hypothetical protein